MKIEISKGVYYLSDKPLELQDVNVQNKVLELMSKKADIIETEIAGAHPRPLAYVWVYTGFIIERQVTYLYPADSNMNGLCTERIRIIKKI